MFKAKKVYTGVGPALSPGMIHVRDGKVVRVAESIDASAGVESVDLGDAVVIPGIVNFATTLGVSGGDAEVTKEVTPKFNPLKSIDWQSREFRQARSMGVTSAAIFPGGDAVVSGLVSVVKTAGAGKAERIVKPDVALAIAMGNDPTSRNAARGRPDSIYMRQPTNRMGVVWLLRSSLQKAKADAGDELRPALDAKLPFFCTARVGADVEAVVRLAREFGFSPVVVGGEEAYQYAEVLAQAKTPVVLKSIGTTMGVGPEQTDAFWNQAGVLHQAGVTVAIAGDQPLDMARFAIRYGLPADVALQAITATPAKLLGVENRVGTLAEGKDADFAVLTGEPFEFTTNVKDVALAGRTSAPAPSPRGPLADRSGKRAAETGTETKAKNAPKG